MAQAFGGRWRGRSLGTLGHAGAFSFYPTKNLGAFGDAGLLTTNDDEVARMARKLRTHGAERRDLNEMIGYNSRLDEIQAAVLRVKLPYVELWNRERRRAAATYRRLLGRRAGHFAADRRRVRRARVQSIHRPRDGVAIATPFSGRWPTRAWERWFITRSPSTGFPSIRDHHADLPVAEKAAREVLSLPIGPMLSNHAIGRVVDALRQACAATAPGEVVAA